MLTGETTSYKVTIAAGATVTLDGVTISGGSYCIKCLGEATIILKDGSTNTLTSTSTEYPALSIGDANTTLTIQGSTGVLNVTSGNYCAGIGGGYSNADVSVQFSHPFSRDADKQGHLAILQNQTGLKF